MWDDTIMHLEAIRVNWGRLPAAAAMHSQYLCGRLLAELHVRDGEIGLASRTLAEGESFELGPVEPESSPKWTRWAVCTGGSAIELCPSLPDLPVLAEADEPFSLAPGEIRRAYVRVPLTVVFRVNDQLDEILAELPTRRLERCRFGENADLEWCYYLPGGLTRGNPGTLNESEVVAPVTIRNEADETLEVDRFCLRVAPLSIYESNGSLWSSETLVRFQGGSSRSRVSILPGPPAEIPAGRLVTAARKKSGFFVGGRSFRALTSRGSVRRGETDNGVGRGDVSDSAA